MPIHCSRSAPLEKFEKHMNGVERDSKFGQELNQKLRCAAFWTDLWSAEADSTKIKSRIACLHIQQIIYYIYTTIKGTSSDINNRQSIMKTAAQGRTKKNEHVRISYSLKDLLENATRKCVENNMKNGRVVKININVHYCENFRLS